jgi:hypothetical protein
MVLSKMKKKRVKLNYTDFLKKRFCYYCWNTEDKKRIYEICNRNPDVDYKCYDAFLWLYMKNLCSET